MKVHLLMVRSGELEQGEFKKERGLVRKRCQTSPSKKTENTVGISVGKCYCAELVQQVLEAWKS